MANIKERYILSTKTRHEDLLKLEEAPRPCAPCTKSQIEINLLEFLCVLGPSFFCLDSISLLPNMIVAHSPQITNLIKPFFAQYCTIGKRNSHFILHCSPLNSIDQKAVSLIKRS